MASSAVLAADKRHPRSPLDEFLASTAGQPPATTSGSLYSPGAPFLDLGRDLRARTVNDLVTIVVRDRASAIARGTMKASRSGAAQGSVNAVAGVPPMADRLRNLLAIRGASSLEGEGETSREMLLSTTLTGRVTQVLPNGLLVIEAAKSVRVNSEIQEVLVRGIARPVDLSAANRVLSDDLAYLEVSVNGKGVVGDAVRRPNLLYRILLGLLPF